MWLILLKVLIFLVIVCTIGSVIYLIMHLTGIDTIDGLQEFCNKYKGYSYTIIICLQVIQVVFIPISNQIITIPAIAVLGMFPAFICSFIGIEIGTVILYFIGRYGGGKFLQWLLGDKEKAEKVKNLINSRRLFYPVGMLIAIIPDDLLTTLAGVAKMSFWYILIVSAITRALCIAYTVFGIGLLSSTWWGIMIFGVVTIGIMALGYVIIRYEPKIEDFFKRKFRK